MAEIVVKDPNSPYSSTLSTGPNEVIVHNAYVGVRFVSDGGELLSVSIRDNGFELRYWSEAQEDEFDHEFIEFKNGKIKLPEKES